MKHHRYLIACVLPFLFPYSVLCDKSTQQYLSEGNDYLTSGEFNNALTSFDAAIRHDPENYLTYFKRATAYLSLGRNNAAVDDFSKILDLKPDFDQVLLQRARIYVKEGSFSLAILDLEKYISNHPQNEESIRLLNDAKNAQVAMQQAQVEKENGNYEACISLTSTAARVAPLFAHARLLRAQCHVAAGSIVEAAGDLTRVAQLNPSDPEPLILLSKINFYSLNEPQGALSYVKQCLHYDPEQKQCKKLFRKIKKLNKEITAIEKDIELKKYATAANRLIGTSNRQGILDDIKVDFEDLEKDLNTTSNGRKELISKCYQLACKLYGQQKEDDKVELWCSLALENRADDVEALMYRGEMLLNRKEYKNAVKDLTAADEAAEGRNNKIKRLLQQAQQKLKLSKKRDYYKILDVSPNADSREIKRAYRKMAHQWHPDKYSGDLDKSQVENKMADINQAYEVLSDDDKRQQYDNGFDPYDPEQGGGNSGGNPFHHQQEGGFHFQNGFPFGQGFPGGPSFKFNF